MCVSVPISQYAVDIAASSASGVNESIATAVHSFMMMMPTQCYSCLPELQMREAMLECKSTQVTNGRGQVIGVRACCPSCKKNEFVKYCRLRTRPLDDMNAMSFFVDVLCQCRNPLCTEVVKKMEKLNLTADSDIPDNVCYSFSNVDSTLVHEIYPPIASSLYPFITRPRGAIHNSLRRLFFSSGAESELHAKHAARYQDYYKMITVPNYLKLVQRSSSIERGHFQVPAKSTPVKGMGVAKLKKFIDDMWTETDREMIVRHLMTLYPRHTLISDYTFEIARLLDGDSSCAVIILNEDQMPLFIGFCDKEDGVNTRLAHFHLKNRCLRLGKDLPKNAIDDRCCNSHAVTVDTRQGLYAEIYGMLHTPRKDAFHFMQLANKCLVPANKGDVAATRAKVVERTREIIWEKKMSQPLLLGVCQKTSQTAVKDLEKEYGLRYTTTTLDEVGLTRALVASRHHSHKTIKTTIAAIAAIRDSSHYNSYIRKVRTSSDAQVGSIDDFIKMLEDPANRLGVEMQKVVRVQTQYASGFLEFLKRAKNHAARGCYESGLDANEQYTVIPPPGQASIQLPRYAVVESQSPLENLNRQVGDHTRSVGAMRDEAVERGAFINIFWYSHRRRLRLGLTTDNHPFSFLWDRTGDLIRNVFGSRAAEYVQEPVNTTVELEPMGLDFARAIKKEQIAMAINTTTMCNPPTVNSVSSSSSSSSSS